VSDDPVEWLRKGLPRELTDAERAEIRRLHIEILAHAAKDQRLPVERRLAASWQLGQMISATLVNPRDFIRITGC
jgi:hypothetical protein